ncbi:MAG: DUF1501 domain-containing protein [Paraburkholderia tropica]|uniref:DUF1501 domain-containing protein n=1 Tax=Paraburkholderia tropica TaxID=92647 RepID=UPI00160A3BB2|nr:DUF1501 domain-containing protein [Paraburkholderia tropica]MBB2984765.1 uncharacterized protein (DUF1501 family) [Paraburkholderia tropica]
MKRRHFLQAGAASLGAAFMQPGLSLAFTPANVPDYTRLLILVELKGGNDGLNTIIPYASPYYAQLRPTIGIPRDRVIQLDAQTGMHPAMQALLPLWQQHELAIVQGVSYPAPSLSHFRSIEIWNTASASDQYLGTGWLTRAFQTRPVPPGFAADAVVVGSAEMGPLTNGAHAIALVNPQQFLRDAHLARPFDASASNPEMAHVLEVEHDIQRAADRLRPTDGQFVLQTTFPPGQFGNLVRTAMQVVAASETPSGGRVSGKGVAVIQLTLNGFDTHHDQPGQHENLLRQFSEGMAAMRSALVSMNRWNSTLIMTYAEFGRRARENGSRGTDHGTVAPHFIAGGAVEGGLYGVPPELDRLDGNGNLPVGVDFRSLYATVLDRWWDIDSRSVLGGRFSTMPVIRT